MIINKVIINGIELINLIPEYNKILFKDGIYSDSVYLGTNDSIDNWIEIDNSLMIDILYNI